MSVLSYILIVFFVYSFMGWICEVSMALVQSKKFVNRGFLFGPFIPIYGFGALAVIAIYSFLEDYSTNILILIAFAAIALSFIELFTGIMMEKIFNARWWDYSDMKFNFMGHISLVFSSLWGIFAYLLITYLHPMIKLNILNLDPFLKVFLAGMGLIYFIFDIALSITAVSDMKRIVEKHPTLEKLREYLSDRPGRIIIFKKTLSAFPKLRFKIYPNLHLDIKSIIGNTHDRVGKVVDKIKQNK